jgi:hypothetical protein
MIYPLVTFEIIFCIMMCVFIYKSHKLNKKDEDE